MLDADRAERSPRIGTGRGRANADGVLNVGGRCLAVIPTLLRGHATELQESAFGLAKRTAVPIGRLLVVGGSLHFAKNAFPFTELLEAFHHLLNGFVGPGSYLDHFASTTPFDSRWTA